MPEVLGFGFIVVGLGFGFVFLFPFSSQKHLSASGAKQMSESQPIPFLQLRVNIFSLDLTKEKVANGQSEVLRGNAHFF